MARMIFVNLPVSDLEKSTAFYKAIGFEQNPKFSDETGSGMVWSDTIFVMLLTHDKWKSFTDRPICPADSSEVMLCLSFDSREDVDAINAAAGKSGGTADLQEMQDHGFMMSRTFGDPDNHVWEAMWMDPAVANSEEPLPEVG